MDGVVRVRPIFASAPAGLPFTVSWALAGTTPATNTGNQFDVHYRVGTSRTWKVWKNDTSARSGVFGQNGQPVQVHAGSHLPVPGPLAEGRRRTSPAAGRRP